MPEETTVECTTDSGGKDTVSVSVDNKKVAEITKDGCKFLNAGTL